MDQPILDAVLIIKDEEKHLPACLTALQVLRPLLGGIYVYDTGSTDDSIAICESFGCTVQRGYWDDDFARARNAASAMASATWLLHVDADETALVDVDKLRSMLQRSLGSFDVLHFTVRSWNSDRLIGDAPIGRLVRRETTTFVGRVHEHAVAAHAGAHVRSAILPSDILMMSHLGYSGPGTMQRKSERNVAISDTEVERCSTAGTPEDDLQLALIHRVRANSALGRWDVADRDLREIRTMSARLPTRVYAGELLVDRALTRSDTEEAVALLGEVVDEGSDPQWVRWKLACLSQLQGDPQAAWSLMQRVDNVVNAMGETVSPVVVLYDRARLAIDAGCMDEAVATALVLVGRHGQTDFIPFLLAAWASWPPAVMAGLLAEPGDLFARQIRAALARAGEVGVAVLTSYDALTTERRSATRVATR